MIKPILFNSEMVKAIMDGRKTVTRRVVKKRYENTDLKLMEDVKTIFERQNDTPAPVKFVDENGVTWYKHTVAACAICNPPYQAGDILWVRETWAHIDFAGEYGNGYVFKASDNGQHWKENAYDWKWHPSIHMPREAARIFLRVTDVRAERLREINEIEAEREGVRGITPTSVYGTSAVVNFETLWNSTIKPADIDRYGWDANPWVWVIEFERYEKPKGWCDYV